MPRRTPPTASVETTRMRPQRGIAMRVRVAWAWRVALVLFVLWLLLAGPASWPVGAAVALAGAAIGAWIAPGEPHPWRPVRLFGFALYFLRASLLGGIDVARRAWRVRVDVAPCFATYRLALPAGQPRTMMIGIVSLLPGTLSAALDASRSELLVHALDAGALASVPELERRVAWLFGLQIQPACPQPLAGAAP